MIFLKIGVFIPTLNAGSNFDEVLNCIDSQIGNYESEKLIIDSNSTDDTCNVAKKHGYICKSIDKKHFTHGFVRNCAVEILDQCKYIFFLTQDAYVKKNALGELLRFIRKYENMVIAYGRQTTTMDKVNIIDFYDRAFNYPEKSIVKKYEDKNILGIKTVFSSDVFSIYDRELLLKIGNFPKEVKFAEDMLIAAIAIKKGYSVGYCADAICVHNQKLSYRELYKRYCQIGEFHATYPWIQNEFGKNTTEGIKLTFFELNQLIKSFDFLHMPDFFIRTLIKFVAYKFN